MQVRADDAAYGFSVNWALGTLDDGQHEVLGVWPDPIAGALNWQEVFDDLAARGVERISFVVNADPETVRAAHPRATMLSSAALQPGTNLASSAALSARLRRIVDSADAAAQLVQAELTRLVRRHGSFESPAAALVILEMAVQRLEHRSWAHPPVQAVSAGRRRPNSEPGTATTGWRQ